MPSERQHLYHARRSWFAPKGPRASCGAELVEAPGTAPGSATLIPQAVYRHSRLPDRERYRMRRPAAQSRAVRRRAMQFPNLRALTPVVRDDIRRKMTGVREPRETVRGSG